MKKIVSEVQAILETGPFGPHSVKEVASCNGKTVETYEELVDHVAQIGYLNPQFTLFFRGQHTDYREEGASSLFPSLWRDRGPSRRNQALQELNQWCERLKRLRTLSTADRRRLRGIRERPWAILQHYSSTTRCDTPLLDVTGSLRVAASIATQGYLGKKKNTNPYGMVFVFGFPAIYQGTTISVDDELVLLRLSSVCPKTARRPHFQSGFLAGTFPSESLSGRSHKDFARRLIGKLRVSTADSFWNVDSALLEHALFPTNDSLRDELERCMTGS